MLLGRASCLARCRIKPIALKPTAVERTPPLFTRWAATATSTPRPDPLPPIHPPARPLPVVAADGEASISSSPLILRPYQLQAITSCLDALSSGLSRIGVSSPTGSGKTTMFMSLIPQIPAIKKRGQASSENSNGRTLILVSSVELARQAELAAKRLLGPGWSVEVEQSKRIATGRADVTVATFQTLLNPDRLRKFDPSTYKLVIVDEAHHAAAVSYLRILQYFHEDVELPPDVDPVSTPKHGNRVPIIGFSATFSRPDQLALNMVFQQIVFHREVSSMLEEGWLAPAKTTTIAADLKLDYVPLTASGDFSAPSLSRHLNTPAVTDLIVRSYLHLCASRRSTLVFCVDLAHVATLTAAFRSAGIDARSISSLSPAPLRRDTITAFAKGEFPMLVNCEILTEGTDIPEIDCVLLARPTKSRNLLAQMVGRGLRLCPETGKKDCHVIDMVDTVGKAGSLVVGPTLSGLRHEELGVGMLGGGGLGLPREREQEVVEVKRVKFIDQTDPFGVLSGKGSPAEIPLKRMSANAWVSCGPTKFILDLLGEGHIKVEASGVLSLAKSSGPNSQIGQWAITFHPSEPPYWALQANRFVKEVKQVAMAEDLERALQTADTWAVKKFGRSLATHLSRYAPWRRRPASERQVNMLLKMKIASQVPVAEGASMEEDMPREVIVKGTQMPSTELTAGEVNALICARKNGAKGLSVRIAQAEAAKTKKKRRRQDAILEKKLALAARNLPLPRAS